MFSFSWRKFFAFEWIMFLLVGCFWATAVTFPLYLVGALKHIESWPKYLPFIIGPYIAYFVLRCLWLLGQSIWWAYWTESVFYRSWAERRFAQEWFRVAVFGFGWALLAALPMLYFKVLFHQKHFFASVGILFFPYFVYLFFKFLIFLFDSVRWATLELMDAPEAKLKRK